MLKKAINRIKAWDYKTWLPMILTVITICNTVQQSKLQTRMATLEQIFQPLNFSISRGESTCVYQISSPQDGVLAEIPAYPVKITVDTGAYREFTQIRYSEADGMELASADLNVLESGQYEITATGQIPSTNYDSGGLVPTAYDYFFVYTVSASGERELWLIYYELDLPAGTVSGPFKAGQSLLLLRGEPMPASKAQMLESYWVLSQKAAELPL